MGFSLYRNCILNISSINLISNPALSVNLTSYTGLW